MQSFLAREPSTALPVTGRSQVLSAGPSAVRLSALERGEVASGSLDIMPHALAARAVECPRKRVHSEPGNAWPGTGYLMMRNGMVAVRPIMPLARGPC
jgi:hypothetical protein